MALIRGLPSTLPLATAMLAAAVSCGFAQDIDPQNVPGMPSGPQVQQPGPGTPYPFPEVQDGNGEVIPGPGRRMRPYSGQSPMVIGPGGVIPRQGMQAPRKAEAPKPLTPEQRADKIRKALAPKPPFDVSRRATLDKLYAKLAAASDEEEAKGLAGLIAKIWLRTPSDTAALLMQRAMVAADKKDYAVSLDLLDRVVETQPAWPEAWNRRATVRFLQGDLNGSMEDVEHVLRLDPNHFAALQGMGMILQKTGLDKRALEVYRRALAIYPHQPQLEELVKTLALKVEGQGI